MDVMIVGTGAMACLFAARLAAGGSQVMMLGSWLAGIEAINRNGVCIREKSGDEFCYPVKATSDPSDCQKTHSALVLVKSWQTERAARQLAGCLDNKGVALTLQNGLGNYEVLSTALGADRVALGVTTAGGYSIEPGKVQVAGNGKIVLGNHPSLEPLADDLHSAGFQIELVADPNSLLWGKLVVNATINPITALLRIPNGELLTRPFIRQIMVDTAQEAGSVAEALGIKLPYADPVKAVEEVARQTSTNISSMLQDVLRGAPTEIEAINGAIVRKGVMVNVATPLNTILYRMVKSLEPQLQGVA